MTLGGGGPIKTDIHLPKPVLALFGVLTLLAVGTIILLASVTMEASLADKVQVPVAKPAPVGRPGLAYAPEAIGFPMEGQPLVTFLAIVDLDADGLPDVLVCDAAANRVGWIRQAPRGVFTETWIGDPVAAPARAAWCDLNGDGRVDVLVAGLGRVESAEEWMSNGGGPTNDRIGQVVWLENLGGGKFRNRVLADHLARVTDVRAADLNGDGRMDVVIAESGLEQGVLSWLENMGRGEFSRHVVAGELGALVAPVADFDRDGKMDVAALATLGESAVHLFKNPGAGKVRDQTLWKTEEAAWGGSGLIACDLNGDGRPDLLASNGDGAVGGFTEPAPWHGLQWLENREDGTFGLHRIGRMPGCYSPVAVDVNGDGFTDIVAVAGAGRVIDAGAASLVAWINDGQQHFLPVPLAYEPTRLGVVAAGDLDGKGVPALVTGGFHGYPPYTHMSRVVLWRRP